MSSEAAMWQVLRPHLDALGLDPVRVENSACPGTPDVNYTGGWIELKHENEWPKRVDTPLRVPHFTPQQRVWLIRRYLKGGRAFMLLRVKHDWLLFDGVTAAKIVGHLSKQELIMHALMYCPGGIDRQELQRCLTK